MNTTKYEFRGKRILIVEDIEMYREIESKRLSMAGFEVDKASNGQEALDLYLNNEVWHYHAIIMDIIMPVMDGRTCAKLIRSTGREDSLCIPIISISDDNTTQAMQESLEVGIDEFLDKPINFLALFDKLDYLLTNYNILHPMTEKANKNSTKYLKLWKLLLDRGLTKTQLQEMIKCSSKTIAKLSKGETVNLSTLQKICQALECKLSDIMEVD